MGCVGPNTDGSEQWGDYNEGLMIEEIKRLQAENEKLRAENEKLSHNTDALQAELSALRSQVAAALVADGQWMQQTDELRKQVSRLRSLLARYREHVMAHESIDYLGHGTGMPPNTFLPPALALSADEADDIRAIAVDELPEWSSSIKD